MIMQPNTQAELTVNQLVDLYLAWARREYVKPSGKPTRTADNLAIALRSLTKAQTHDGTLIGSLPASSMGKHLMLQVRESMADSGRLVPRTINERLTKIVGLFTWAAQRDLVDETMPSRLQLVERIKPGRRGLKNPPPVEPVAEQLVMDTTLAFTRSADLAAERGETSRWLQNTMLGLMVEIQASSGMRPGELVAMNLDELTLPQTPDGVCVYQPLDHKTAHYGKTREIGIAGEGLSALLQWLNLVEKLRAQGLDAMPSSYLWPGKGGAGHLRASSYGQSIARICKRYKLEHWHPNQLRHAFACRIRDRHGLDVAQVLMGHSKAETTQRYGRPNKAKAFEALREGG